MPGMPRPTSIDHNDVASVTQQVNQVVKQRMGNLSKRYDRSWRFAYLKQKLMQSCWTQLKCNLRLGSHATTLLSAAMLTFCIVECS